MTKKEKGLRFQIAQCNIEILNLKRMMTKSNHLRINHEIANVRNVKDSLFHDL